MAFGKRIPPMVLMMPMGAAQEWEGRGMNSVPAPSSQIIVISRSLVARKSAIVAYVAYTAYTAYCLFCSNDN